MKVKDLEQQKQRLVEQVGREYITAVTVVFRSYKINIKCIYFASDFAGVRSRKTVSVKREWVYGVQRATTYKTWSQTRVRDKPSKTGEGEKNLGLGQMSSFS